MIELQHLNFSYKPINVLFEDLSLSLASGGVCGLLGKNGAGKSSLLKVIAGLVYGQHGECQVLGEDPAKRSVHSLSDLFFLGEEFLSPKLNIHDYLKLYAPLYPRFNEQEFYSHIKEFNLDSKKQITEFSYGQKKKFMIAFGLAANTRLLLLDEPTNGFDIPSKSQFRKLIAGSLNEDRLVIISTHQVHDVENLIDSIVMLDSGKIVLNTTLVNIAQKLVFEHQANKPSIDECIYYEPHLGGYTVLRLNKTYEDTQIDVEMLFKAMLENPTQLKNFIQ